VLRHDQGHGGCLVRDASAVASKAGILLDLNFDGRIREAVARAGALGGKVLEPTHTIGRHGFRRVILDSESHRMTLHSRGDA